MVKWKNSEMVKWCNKICIHLSVVLCQNKYIAMVQRMHTSSHNEIVKHSDEMAKWCNNKQLHFIMMKWYNKYGEMMQVIHTCSHGEMVKHSSGDILFEKGRNGEMVKRLYSPSSALSSTSPSTNGY